jgi:beta-glucosidase
MTGARFPFHDRPRLWGTAVSHYQVEGGDRCDWTEWEEAGRTRGEPAGAAVGSWERYELDAELAAAAGANSFRFSISWSRVEPRRGEFDYAALARYRRLTDHLNALGLEPVVTLFHYTHPVWFHGDVSWQSTRSVHRFGEFARRVVEALGSSVRCYVPLNEPLVFLLGGFLDGQIPPGLADRRTLGRVLDHLLAAHVEAAAVIRELQPAAAIGIAHNMMAFVPERPFHPFDRLLSRVAHRCYNRGLIEAAATGRWDFILPPNVRIRGRRNDLPASLDLFGVNFYSRLHLRCPGSERFIGDFRYRDIDGSGLTDNGWEIIPDAAGSLLREAAKSNLPLVVTENGLADADDVRRASFIERHLQSMTSAGVPLHGYFYWSLLDNYEWLDGFGPKFGLYSVDHGTMQRTPRRSIETFRRLGEEFVKSSSQ